MIRRRERSEAGVTLVETLVAMSLTLVVGALLTTGVVNAHKLYRFTEDESLGQTDVRTTIERLGRDVRNARSLDAGATQSQLVLWIDSNSDYQKQASEVVTWSLQGNAENHFDVARTVNGQTTRTARLVISQLAFCYKIDPAAATCLASPLSAADARKVLVISSDIEYDARLNNGAGSRHASFIERIRNVSG